MQSVLWAITAVQWTLYKYAMPVWVSWWNVSPREHGFPEGVAQGKTILPRGDIPSGYPHWHGIFVLLYRTNPNLVKYQWKQQWLPVDPVRTVDVLPVDMMEWPTFVSQSRLTIFTWGIIIWFGNRQSANHGLRSSREELFSCTLWMTSELLQMQYPHSTSWFNYCEC